MTPDPNLTPRIGSRWVNKHTGEAVNVLMVGRPRPAAQMGNEQRVLSSADLPGEVDNGWSLTAWHEHWRQEESNA